MHAHHADFYSSCLARMQMVLGSLCSQVHARAMENNGACNLSIAIAEIGRKVLLIDGDLRRPRLHKVFSTANSGGLSDVLWAEGSLETAPLSDLVRETEVSGLWLLPAGSCGVTPSNLFYSPRMSRLLRRLRTEFDMILIDAPPMIHLADARVLGRLADGVILVVRAGQTTTESALLATQRFAEDGTHVLGTVLNSWDPKLAETTVTEVTATTKRTSRSKPRN